MELNSHVTDDNLESEMSKSSAGWGWGHNDMMISSLSFVVCTLQFL